MENFKPSVHVVAFMLFADFLKSKRPIFDEKKTLRSSQDLNLGLLNAGQMLLPTEPLELWHWSRG